jgi:hypothetical protein
MPVRTVDGVLIGENYLRSGMNPEQHRAVFFDPTTGHLMCANQAGTGWIDIGLIQDAGADIWIGSSTGIRTPLQPVFSVIKSANQNNIAAAAAVLVTWETEILDVGSNFDLATETYTAPVSGAQLLAVCLRCDNVDTASNWFRLRIVTSNRTYEKYWPSGQLAADAVRFGFTYTVVADMDASDTALVQVETQGGAAQTDIIAGSGTRFEGWFLG